MRLIVLTLCAFLLTACSKTIQWEEEVPLNTGETIWVKRTVVYSPKGDAGNPLDTAYRPEKDGAIEFTWDGRRFYYRGEAVIMVLAISPARVPILVAAAPDNSWEARYKYACTYPYYVQLVPDESGRTWNWPPKIEPWLYDLPTNLFREFGNPDQMLRRYSVQQKRFQSYLADPRLTSMHKIDPTFTGDLCKRTEK